MMVPTDRSVDAAYEIARERYAAHSVDAAAALAALAKIPVSLHCWQGDDVGGFEHDGRGLGGGLAVTGNYPGRARTPDELWADLAKATDRRAARDRHPQPLAGVGHEASKPR